MCENERTRKEKVVSHRSIAKVRQKQHKDIKRILGIIGLSSMLLLTIGGCGQDKKDVAQGGKTPQSSVVKENKDDNKEVKNDSKVENPSVKGKEITVTSEQGVKMNVKLTSEITDEINFKPSGEPIHTLSVEGELTNGARPGTKISLGRQDKLDFFLIEGQKESYSCKPIEVFDNFKLQELDKNITFVSNMGEEKYQDLVLKELSKIELSDDELNKSTYGDSLNSGESIPEERKHIGALGTMVEKVDADDLLPLLTKRMDIRAKTAYRSYIEVNGEKLPVAVINDNEGTGTYYTLRPLAGLLQEATLILNTDSDGNEQFHFEGFSEDFPCKSINIVQEN